MTANDLITWMDKLGVTHEALGQACIPPVTRQCVCRYLNGSRTCTDGRLKELLAALKRVVTERRRAQKTWGEDAKALLAEIRS